MGYKFNPLIFSGLINSSSSGGGGDITTVNAGTGLDGGGASGAVTLDLADTAVTPGSYTNANITVDAQGRLTAAANGTDNGEANTASNLGAGSGVFNAKVGVDLQFKSLVAGSGISITPSATELLIASTVSSGANTTLSNLVAPTSIPVDLIFNNTGTPFNIITEDMGAGSSDSLFVSSGDSSAGSGAVTVSSGISSTVGSGSLTLSTGSSVDNTSGVISIISGNTTNSGSGGINLTSGNALGPSGAIQIVSGNSSANDSGSILLQTGTASGIRGDVNVNAENLILADTHLVATQSTAPTIVVNANAGTGATADVAAGSSDNAGQFSITTGTVGIALGAQAQVTFNRTFPTGTFVVLQPANANAAIAESAVGIYITSTATTFDISANISLSTASTYIWNYLVIGN